MSARALRVFPTYARDLEHTTSGIDASWKSKHRGELPFNALDMAIMYSDTECIRRHFEKTHETRWVLNYIASYLFSDIIRANQKGHIKVRMGVVVDEDVAQFYM